MPTVAPPLSVCDSQRCVPGLRHEKGSISTSEAMEAAA